MTLSEIKTFRTLPPEEREKIIREFQSFINAKKDELQAFVRIVKTAAGTVDLKELNPSLEYQKVLRGELENLESDYSKMRRIQEVETESDRDEFENDEGFYNGQDPSANTLADLEAIASAISGQGVLNIRPDVSKFITLSRALTYKQILDREVKEETCERREEVKQLIREILNTTSK